jgi:putative transposase
MIYNRMIGVLQTPHDLQPSHDMNILNTDVHMNVCKTPIHSPSQTVGAIVRGFKSSVTKQWVAMGFTGKLWQRNYYEHIIRNEQSYHTISKYILNNPLKWEKDTFFRNVP